MNHKRLFTLIMLIIMGLLLIGCSPAGGPVTDNRDIEPPAGDNEPVANEPDADDEPATDDEPVGLANPASVYCEEQGSTLEMRSDAEGNQFGVCIFPDGSEWEEWAYFRSECAPGGMQLFDTLWVLQSFGGEEPLSGTTPTLRLTPDWEVNGSTGCNSFFGSVTRDEESWEVGEIASTVQDCEDSLMAQETAVRSLLQSTTHHALNSDTLTLHGPDGDLVYAPAENLALEEAIWILNGISQGDAVVSTWIDTEIYLQFMDGAISGYTGCNSLTGSYEVDGNTLTFSPLALSRRACDEERDAREFELVQALDQVAGYDTELDTLTLVNEAGEAVASFVAGEPPAELAGSRWELQSYGGKSVLPDAPVTIEFVEEGQLSGSAGCNRFFGSYELDAGSFSVGPLGSTEMWCEGAMDQETAVLSMLQSATNLIHDGNSLVINTGEGEMVLTLAP